MDQIINKEQLKKLQQQMPKAITLHAKMQNVGVLLNSPSDLVDAFAQSSSMKILTQYLKDALKQFPATEELVDKILALILRINLNEEILRESEIGEPLLKIKDKRLLENYRSNTIDQIQSKWTKCYNKYRQLLEDWRKSNQMRDKYEDYRKKKVKKNSNSSSSDSSHKKKKLKKKQVRYILPANFCRFVKDDLLLNYKYFKKEDEPNQRGMTFDEVLGYQKLYAEELKRLNQVNGAYNIKHRESLMEGQSHRQQLDSLQQMVEQIPFMRPMKLLLPSPDIYDTNLVETAIQQKRTESKMLVYYHRDSGIPNEPGYSEISNTQFGVPPKIIHLDPPKREDLMFMVQVICNRGLKELEEKNKNANRKPLKGILKKPPEEQSKMKDVLNQAKQDLEPKMKLLVSMVGQKHDHSQESILTLLHDIIQKLKEIGEELYIKNVKSLLEQKLNDKQSIISDDLRIKAQQEHQQRMRLEQLQTMNPIQAQRIRAYKTKHCHNYHSAQGCTRGDNCNFIHDSRYPGRPAPTPQYPNFLNKTLYPQNNMHILVPPLLQQLSPAILLGKQRRYESL